MYIINPGSEIKGGTLEQAKINAKWYSDKISEMGISGVDLEYIGYSDGLYIFHFTHQVTKKIATLYVSGYTEEQENEFMFRPRDYWNGNSCGIIDISDWLTDDYRVSIEYVKKVNNEGY